MRGWGSKEGELNKTTRQAGRWKRVGGQMRQGGHSSFTGLPSAEAGPGRSAGAPTRVTRCKAWYRRMYLGQRPRPATARLPPVPTCPVSLSVPTFAYSSYYCMPVTLGGRRLCLRLCACLPLPPAGCTKSRSGGCSNYTRVELPTCACHAMDREGPKGRCVPCPESHMFQVRSHVTWGSCCVAYSHVTACATKVSKQNTRTVPNRNPFC